MHRARDAVTWLDSEPADEGPMWSNRIDRFRVEEVEFRGEYEHGSKPDRFFICKIRRQVEEYLDVLDEHPRANIVELGIAEGGSVALTALVSPPKKMVALDLDPQRVDALDQLIERLDLAERVRPYYGVDQADRDRVEEIIDDEFGAEQLDLVIDDASHQLEPTRASFEMLFPRLRPGGLYVIEDWNGEGFGRAFGEALADPDSPAFAEFERRLREEPAAVELAISRMTRTRLTIELVLAQAESDEVISEVAVRHLLVRVRRGSGHLDPRTFRLSQLYTDHLGLLSGGLVPAS